MITAVYPGSFDPITLGHMNIIRRAARAFDTVVVLVLANSEKNCTCSIDERVSLIRKCIEDLPNVEVATFSGLLAEYCRTRENPVIVKGLRAVSDFEYEFQMALINNKINPDLETVFLTAAEKYTYLSSSAVRELAKYGADLSGFVPRQILEEVTEKYKRRP